MIIEFSAENFKSIKDTITLSFKAEKFDDLEDYYIIKDLKNIRLLKLGIIYGANASGKTTIIEAINFLREIVLNPFEKKIEKFDFEPFLFNQINKNKNTIFALEFIFNHIKYLYNIELNKTCVVKESLYFYSPNKALVYKRNTNEKKQLVDISFGPKIKIKKERKTSLIGNTLWNNTVLGGYLKTNFESDQLHDVVTWFETTLKPTITPNTSLIAYISNKVEEEEINKDTLVKILNKADFGISDILYASKEINIDDKFIDMISKQPSIPKSELERIKNKGKIETKEILLKHSVSDDSYLLSIENESAGTKRYYEFAGILEMLLNGENIIPIDELESSLHPDLVKHFLLTFLVNSNKSQLIVTTHFRELLLEKDILRNDVIWFTERKKDGSTDLFNLTDFDSSVVRRTTGSIYNAYKIGKFGAVPDLDDYYIGRTAMNRKK